ncbi:MAG TPA: SufS family cysteine desulfurase [Pirellulaceae bacterium]|nr:SufS family cysteine desulfurase [Pirellulaceae bacterium]
MNAQSTAPPVLDVEAIRADFPILHQTIHRQRPLVYFDNASTTQHPQVVIDAMQQMYQHHYANVHRGIHYLSEQASGAYEQARETIRNWIHARHLHEIIFTSGTTASINLVARAWGDQNVGAGDEILLTIAEHHSNLVPWQQLAERRGARVIFCELTFEPEADLQTFRRLLTPKTRIAPLTAVSNVLGYRLPIKSMIAAAHEVGAKVLVDAAQHSPHEPTDVADWDCDFLAFSGHKMLGPTGIGILYGKEALLDSMPPFMGGGSMIHSVTRAGFTPGELPAKFEAGTPPIVEAIGLAAAIRYLDEVGLNRIAEHERRLTRQAHERLNALDGIRILGSTCEYKSGIVGFCVTGASHFDLAVQLDLRGFAVRLGHHCAMPLHEFLGCHDSLRASFYLYNSATEVDDFADALVGSLERIRT